jgi:uncharacterized membrane protein YdbT with pleckstrin-like domain
MITLQPNEKIILIKHRHQFALMREIFPEILISVAILIFIIHLFFSPNFSWFHWLGKFFPSILKYNLPNLLLFFLSLFLLILWATIFLSLTTLYLDYWVVTNQRTIHAELKGIFSREISSVNHDKIQDITVKIQGFFPTLFHFGDLHIQTAGEFRELVFEEIPEPEKTKEIILAAQREFLKQMKQNGIL